VRIVSGDDLGRKLDLLQASFGEHGVPRAVEDLPPDGRDKLPGLASAPEKHPLWQRILDELADVGLDSYGDLETVPLLHFLSQYPVVPYTYVVSPELSRGERPSVAKLRDLAAQGYQRTVNLCAESPGGDTPLLIRAGLVRDGPVRAGLPGSLHTVHIPIVDMHIPTEAQVVQLLDLVTAADAPRTYLHCEAGKCRTGVMAACYRMAVLGWSVDDAYAEAERFGCSVPQQKEFIRSFGERLQGPGRALGRYPLRPLGSVQPTPGQRAATLVEVARQEKGQPE
jgi:hypothetical protein